MGSPYPIMWPPPMSLTQLPNTPLGLFWLGATAAPDLGHLAIGPCSGLAASGGWHRRRRTRGGGPSSSHGHRACGSSIGGRPVVGRARVIPRLRRRGRKARCGRLRRLRSFSNSRHSSARLAARSSRSLLRAARSDGPSARTPTHGRPDGRRVGACLDTAVGRGGMRSGRLTGGGPAGRTRSRTVVGALAVDRSPRGVAVTPSTQP